MSQPLFRQTALERLSTPDQLDRAMRITSPVGWIGLTALLALAAAGGAWSFVSSAPVKVTTRGMLLAPSGVLDIVSESQGRIAKLLVGAGESVAEGQLVALVSQPDVERDLATTRAELAEKRAQREVIAVFQARDNAAREAVLAQRRANAERSIGFLNERLQWLIERETYEVDMLKRGQIARQRHLDTKIEINTVREAIAQAENAVKQTALEENSASVERERELLNLDLQIESNKRRIESLEDQARRRSELRSPYAGHVVEVKANTGEIINSGMALFSLLPDDPGHAAHDVAQARLAAVMYAAPADGKKIRPGMPAQIAPATVKREEYGYLLGEVETVAEIPSTAVGMQRVLKNPRLVETLMTDGAPFQVTVRLLRDPATPSGYRWSSSRGPDQAIDPGTLAEGTVAVRDVRLISLAIPALEPLLKEAARGDRP